MKICSLYGAGFYYIPGTDTCVKLGGWVRAEYNFNASGSFTPNLNGPKAEFNRESQTTNDRARGIITVDARSQTAYGTLRSYFEGGFQSDNGATPTAATAVYRFFVQLAGFTAGWTVSFFDLYYTPTYSNQTNILGSDSSGSGTTVFAYTASLGNGLSSSLSLEEANARRTGVINTATSAFSPTTGFTSHYAASGLPDLVANLRVDQAWGSAQVMGALHDVSGDYFGTTEGTGHPSDRVGWAVGAGVMFNLPMLGQGDNVSTQVTYTEGALKYADFGLSTAEIYGGNTLGFGIADDAVYNGATSSNLELTRAWSVVAGYAHHWNPAWQSSLYGGYTKIEYNSNAASFLNATLGLAPGSNPNFAYWQIGSRTVWSPVTNLDLSVDVMYNRLDTGYDGASLVLAPGGGKPTGAYTVASQSTWMGIVRVQRNFWP